MMFLVIYDTSMILPVK